MEQIVFVTGFTAVWMFASVFAACRAANGVKSDAVWAVVLWIAAALMLVCGGSLGCLNWWCGIYLFFPPAVYGLVKKCYLIKQRNG